MLTFDSLIQMVVTGIAIGIGSTIGTYIANRGVIKRFDKFVDLIKGGGANNVKNKGENNR